MAEDRAEAEGVGHEGDNALEAERLDEHQIHPALAKPHGVDETTPAGDEHHRRLGPQALDGARDIEPRAFGQGEIGQHHIEAARLEVGEAGQAVRGRLAVSQARASILGSSPSTCAWLTNISS